MDATITKREGNEVTFEFKSTPEALEAGIVYAYNRSKSAFSVPGFRKGKVPRKMVEKQYGAEIFYEDAVNYVLNRELDDVVDGLGLETFGSPNINVKEIGPEKGILFEITYTVKPEVELGEYKGLKVKKHEVDVTEDEIMAEIKKVQDQNARMVEVTDETVPAKEWDVLTINYTGRIGGVPFDGGAGANRKLQIGSHDFVPGFEEQLIGHKIGETFVITVTFPEDYGVEEVAGKEADFEVTIKAMTTTEFPELNDEFAQDVSEFNTLQEYKDMIKDNIRYAKEVNVRKEQRAEAMEQIVASSKMDVPQIMIDEKADAMYEDLLANLKNQGIPIEIYLQYTKKTEDDLKAEFKESAEKNVKGRLILETIAKAENFVVSDEEMDKRIETMAKIYKMDKEKINDVIGESGRKSISEDILVEKAYNLIEDTFIEE